MRIVLHIRSCIFILLCFILQPASAQQVKEIFEIQGTGLSSPFANQDVTTEDNVVTAVGSDRFFIQTPDERDDANPETSNGLMVFTGGRPTVNVGNRVDVTGEVIEFFGLTEFSRPTSVTVRSSNHTAPEPVVLNDTLPSPLVPQSATALERYEGMLVTLLEGMATAPTDPFGKTPMVARLGRTFREPGIQYPGLNGLPVWDGNPEVFLLDPDALGLADNRTIAAGTSVTGGGVLGYAFGRYEFWPAFLQVGDTPELRPVPEKVANEISIGSLNLLRLFRSDADYATRLAKLSVYIRDVMRAPDVLCVQEAATIAELQDLADAIATDPTLVYTPYLMEGNDPGGIDTGFLVRSTMADVVVTPLRSTERNPATSGLLHDRPPLLLTGNISTDPPTPIHVLGLHLRSLNGIEGSDAARVRRKRFEQARSVAELVDSLQQAPNLIVVGDFNAYPFTDGYVDVLGQITGQPDPLGAQLAVVPVVDPPMANQVEFLPETERYSFIFNGNAQVLDHALTGSNLLDLAVSRFAFARGNADTPASFLSDSTTPLHASDHDGPVLYLQLEHPLPVANTEDRLTESPERPTAIATYPNPFREQTLIRLSVALEQTVRVEVYNLLGQRIARLFDHHLAAHTPMLIPFDAGSLPDGVYMIRVIGDHFIDQKMVTLVE